MRFSDFFINYKLGTKEIKTTIPFKELPLFKKIFMMLLFVFAVLGIIFALLDYSKVAFAFIFTMIILVIIFIVIDSRPKNLSNNLTNYHIPYSQERMNMLCELLSNYKINLSDCNKIDLLIEEAKHEQTHCDYYNTLKTPFKTLSALIVPIAVYIAKNYANSLSSNEITALAILAIPLIICFYAILFAVTPMFKDLINRDYNTYENLIADLKQVKIFYA